MSQHLPHPLLCTLQIENQKVEFKENASSKIGSLNNVQHKAGGGNKKIFDDKDYLKQMQGSPCATPTPTSKASSEANLSRTQVRLCYAMLCCAMLCYAMLCFPSFPFPSPAGQRVINVYLIHSSYTHSLGSKYYVN